jgi:hypothetical protein
MSGQRGREVLSTRNHRSHGQNPIKTWCQFLVEQLSSWGAHSLTEQSTWGLGVGDIKHSVGVKFCSRRMPARPQAGGEGRCLSTPEVRDKETEPAFREEPAASFCFAFFCGFCMLFIFKTSWVAAVWWACHGSGDGAVNTVGKGLFSFLCVDIPLHTQCAQK